jgi:hypothetical protein
MRQIALKDQEDLREQLVGLAVVARRVIRRGEVIGRCDTERKISKRLCDGLGALGEGARVHRVAGQRLADRVNALAPA